MPNRAEWDGDRAVEAPPTAARVEAAFASFLARIEDGEEASLEELCAEHPRLASDLRRRHALLEGLGLLPGAAPSAAPVAWDGETVAERIGEFRLLRKLGAGGMGEVWEAEQSSLRRRVVLKLLRSDVRVSERELARFQREAEAGGRLSHPGIVAVHGVGESDGRAYIAQELVPGGVTLRSFLDERREGGELPRDYYAFIAGFFAQVADALQAAHDAGVLHRDVKPQNILIAPGGRPVVADFGLARVADEESLTYSGELAGTLPYMSPEQTLGRNRELGPSTDQFSLGATLYEALTLRRAFEGDTTHQIANQVLYHDPADPRSIRSRVPRELAVICGKALEKRREDRYPSAGALADDG